MKSQRVVNTKNLIAELGWAARFADKETTIPILANVLIEAGAGGLTFTGNNLEIAGQTAMDAEGGAFALAVPHRKMLAFLKKAEGDTVSLEVKEHRLIVTDGDASMTVHGMSRETFPAIPEAGPLIAELAGLKQSIPRAKLAISEEETRFTLNAALLSLSKAGPDLLVATNGHRLSLAGISTNYAGEKPFRALLPKELLHELWWLEVDRVQFWSTEPVTGKKMIKTGKRGEEREIEVDTVVTPRYLKFGVGPRRFVWARGMDGSFPDYERVVPKEYKHAATLETAKFRKFIERVALFSDERSRGIRLEVAAGNMTIKAAIMEHGESQASLPATGCNGAKWKSGFNADYLLEALKLCPESVEFRFNDSIPEPRAIGIVTDGFHYVVMPMRI